MHMVIATGSAIVGGAALTFALLRGDVVSLGTLLGVVLLLNAFARYRLARKEPK
jgi:hypothetical protein